MTPQLPAPPTGFRLGRLFIYIGGALILALAAFALVRAAAFYTLYTWLFAQVLDISGLDIWASRAITMGLLALFLILPWHLVLLPWIGRAKRQVVWLLVLLALALAPMEVATQDVYFSRTDGHPLKYYIKTLDGYTFAASPGTDPVYGIPYKPITADIAREYLLWKKRGGNMQDPNAPAGTYFNPSTGQPLRWYLKLPDGRIDMFTLPGFHPAYGTPLRPVSAEIVAAYRKQQAELDRQRQAAVERQARREVSRTATEEAQRQASDRERLTQPLEPGRYLFGPAPAGDVDGFHYSLTEVDLTPERLQVQMEVANVDRTYTERLHQRSVRLGLLTAAGNALAYTAIRAKAGALPPEGASFAFPGFGQRGAFVIEFTRPEHLDRTFSVVVNDQPLFSGLNLYKINFQPF